MPNFKYGVGCPCCEDNTTDCSECPDGAPLEWSLTVSGITDDACDDCDLLNGTFLLKHRSNCIWSTDEQWECSTTGSGSKARWTLDGTGGSWSLSAGQIVWNLDGTFDCLGNNSFTIANPDEFRCANKPTTLTVSPA